MEVIEKVIKHKYKARIKIYPLGDIHCGTRHCAEDRVRRQVEAIAKEDDAYWIGMGDYGEFITQRDPRWDFNVISPWVRPSNIATDQTNWLADLLTPIKHKCIGLLDGNHEITLKMHSDTDATANLCEKLDVPYLGYSCWVVFNFQRTKTSHHIIKGVFTHGTGNAVTKGAKLNKLERFMNSFEARIYGYAHMHEIITDTKAYMSLSESGQIKERERVGAVTGCWFRTYSQGVSASYGEMKCYPPTVMGCPRFIIMPDESKVEVQR